MRKQSLGGRQVSVIGLGTAEFGGKCPEGQAREFMDAYMALGGDFIDTAHVYGDFKTPRNGESEKVIGRWMADRHNRGSLFISTKGGHPPLSDMRRSRLSREEVRRDMAESLDALQTDHVDIYWLHRDDIQRPVGEIMEMLQGLVEDGSTGLIGVSNWHPKRIREANAYAEAHGLTRLAANQPQFSLAVPRFFGDPTLAAMDAPTWQMHRETGMACCCFSSQAHGFFTKLDELGPEGLPDGLRNVYDTAENRAVYERIKALQPQTGLSVGAIALAWLTCQPFPTFALAGASRIGHVEALREAGDAVITAAPRDALRVMQPME